MHPGQRFSYALVASLALWWPTLQGALHGNVDPVAASIRWVVAFAIASGGVRLIGGLVDRYAEEQGVTPDVDLTDKASDHEQAAA